MALEANIGLEMEEFAFELARLRARLAAATAGEREHLLAANRRQLADAFRRLPELDAAALAELDALLAGGDEPGLEDLRETARAAQIRAEERVADLHGSPAGSSV